MGAPHTWPGLLAALSWLTEMLNYEEKASVARADTIHEGALPTKVIHAGEVVQSGVPQLYTPLIL